MYLCTYKAKYYIFEYIRTYVVVLSGTRISYILARWYWTLVAII